MNTEHSHSNYPKLHATLGVAEGSPPLDLETFMALTSEAKVDGIRFDGIDVTLHEGHLSPEAQDSQIKALAADVRSRGLVIGTLTVTASGVDPGGKAWLNRIQNGCRIGRRLRSLGARPYGVIHVDSSFNPGAWREDFLGAQRRLVDTLRTACAIADGFGERLAVGVVTRQREGHNWQSLLDVIERVNRTNTLGFQADLSEIIFQVQNGFGENQPVLPEDGDAGDARSLSSALRKIADNLRRWTIDLRVGLTEDSTGRHQALPDDPVGWLQLPHHSGFWLHGEDGRLTKALQHLCWDGGSLPAPLLRKRDTWERALASMIAIRDAHGWKESAPRKRRNPSAKIVSATDHATRTAEGFKLTGRRQATLRIVPSGSPTRKKRSTPARNSEPRDGSAPTRAKLRQSSVSAPKKKRVKSPRRQPNGVRARTKRGKAVQPHTS